MKNSNKKRGFTIVELIIVIAVIAILAAVLIPTFSSLINKSLVAADESLVRNLNEALVMDVTNPHNTMTDALKATKENGFDVSKINARASTDGQKHEILWDSRNDCFVYKKGNDINYIPKSNTKGDATPVELWHIANDGTLSDKYSNYLAAGTYEATLYIKMGLDVGEHKEVTKVNYTNTNGKQDVVIRTNNFNTELTINAENDTVTHYGKASKVDDTAVASYHEYGELLGKITLNKGHVVIGSTATVSVIDVKATDAAEIKIDIPESQAVVVMADTAGVVTDGNTKGAIVPESDKVICSLTTRQCYSTMEDAVADGGNLVLLKDYTDPKTGSEFILAPDGEAVKIDLNGYTLTTARQINVYGSLVINGNGKISSNFNAWALFVNDSADLVINAGNDFTVESNEGILSASHSGTINLNGGKYIANNNNNPIINVSSSSAEVEFDSITVESKGNGISSKGISLYGVSATLTNVKVTTQMGSALWLQNCTSEISGGEFATLGSIDTNYASTIVVINGSLNINGAKITYVKSGIQYSTGVSFAESSPVDNNTFIPVDGYNVGGKTELSQ